MPAEQIASDCFKENARGTDGVSRRATHYALETAVRAGVKALVNCKTCGSDFAVYPDGTVFLYRGDGCSNPNVPPSRNDVRQSEIDLSQFPDIVIL